MTETNDEMETRRRARRALLETGARWAEAKRRGHAEGPLSDTEWSVSERGAMCDRRPGLTKTDHSR